MSASQSQLDASAARRLRESLDILASGELPECPVCLDPPAPDCARILRCCAKIMCRECIPSCNRTCPFCRAPFLETARSETEDGESPYTYSTRDYSVHAHFAPTNDYSGTGHSRATRDYKAKDYSTSRTYTASEYKASEYKASDYSAPTAKYTSSTDYSSIAAKYSGSAAGSSSGDSSR